MKICAKDLILRDVIEKDFSAVHEIASQPEVCEFQAWGPNSEEDTKEYFRVCFEEQAAVPRKNYNFVVEKIENNRVIATAGVFSREHNVAEIGFSINKKFWQQGHGTTIATAIRDFCIEELKCLKVIATCDSQNIGSQALLEKVGFKKTDFIESHMKIKGRVRDTIVYEYERES